MEFSSDGALAIYIQNQGLDPLADNPTIEAWSDLDDKAEDALNSLGFDTESWYGDQPSSTDSFAALVYATLAGGVTFDPLPGLCAKACWPYYGTKAHRSENGARVLRGSLAEVLPDFVAECDEALGEAYRDIVRYQGAVPVVLVQGENTAPDNDELQAGSDVDVTLVLNQDGDTPHAAPLGWCNSAAIHADIEEDSITCSISVGDPRGAFTFTIRRRPDTGDLIMHVPHPDETQPHKDGVEYLHPGTYRVK